MDIIRAVTVAVSTAVLGTVGACVSNNIAAAAPRPASDRENTQHWIYDSAVSDEFNGTRLQPTKWTDQVPKWRGRFPSVFEPNNVSVSGGALHLCTRNLNLVEDGSFETGQLAPSWTTWGSGTATLATRTQDPANVEAYQGALRIDGEGGAEQQVTLKPNTKYRLSGYAKVGAGGESVFVGIKNYGGPEIYLPVTSPTYQLVSQEFVTSGNGPIKATIYVYNHGKVGSVYADEISVVPLEAGLKDPLASGETTTAAGIQSRKQCIFGYYECRMRAANAASSSSFWLTNGINEIDVQETFADNPHPPFRHTVMHTNTHHFAGTTDTANGGVYQTITELSAAYHTYGLDWEPMTLTFFFDGKPIRTIPNVINIDPENVLFDTEVFPDWGVAPPSGDNVVMNVDYFRRWTKRS